MNILLTNRCNRRCPYCFAQERVSFSDGEDQVSSAPPFISDEGFEIAVDLAKKSGLPVVGILGGEPSLHPRFVDYLKMTWEAGLGTKVFTNGLWREEQIEAVERTEKKHQKKLNIVLNANGPARTPEAQQKAQEHFLSRLGRFCALSFNISRVDFDPLFLVDLITEYKTRRNIRLGVAQPLARMENEHIDITEYRKMVPTLMELAERCDQNNIRLGFDCGFILCMFTAEELGRLTISGARFKASCGPAIDIGTDLTTWSCFPLSTFSKGVRLQDFENVNQIAEHFQAEFKPILKAGALPECLTCRHRKRGQCPGGCAAHVYRRLNP